MFKLFAHKKILVISLAFFAAGLLLLPFGASAADFANPIVGAGNIQELMCRLVEVLATKLMPPVVVLMVLWASFLFLTAAGQPAKIIQARTTLVWAVIGAAIMLLSVPLVQEVASTIGGTASVQCDGTTTTSNAFEVLYSLINWFAWSIAVLSVAIGLYAGFLYMTSRGEPQKVATAHRVIFYAVVGILVAIIAFSALTIIKDFIGVS